VNITCILHIEIVDRIMGVNTIAIVKIQDNNHLNILQVNKLNQTISNMNIFTYIFYIFSNKNIFSLRNILKYNLMFNTLNILIHLHIHIPKI